MSLELRWIFEGKSPKEVKNWFFKRLESIGDPKESPYEDIYLFNPEVDYSSVKFREDKLDIKWRQNSFEISIDRMKISGVAEDWMFWEWKEKKTADEIQRFIGDKRTHPWVKVDKERSRIKYKIHDNDGSFMPTKDENKADCSIELVRLQLKNKNISWWSLGLDLFAGKKVSKDEKMKMKGIAEYLLKDYPNKNNLNYSNSYAYPKFFSMNVKSIRC
jgi:hypothetical protein